MFVIPKNIPGVSDVQRLIMHDIINVTMMLKPFFGWDSVDIHPGVSPHTDTVGKGIYPRTIPVVPLVHTKYVNPIHANLKEIFGCKQVSIAL